MRSSLGTGFWIARTIPVPETIADGPCQRCCSEETMKKFGFGAVKKRSKRLSVTAQIF